MACLPGDRTRCQPAQIDWISSRCGQKAHGHFLSHVCGWSGRARVTCSTSHCSESASRFTKTTLNLALLVLQKKVKSYVCGNVSSIVNPLYQTGVVVFLQN